MASWVLNCTNCGKSFTHSLIDDVGILNYFMPIKPEFPSGGSEHECPHCRHKSIYQRTDLIYQA